MSSTINADTTSGVIITSDTSGEIKLQSAGADIATVSSTGITMASGKNLVTTAPAFSAYQSSGQSISNATATKIIFDTEEFDTNSNYDNATNYRFTPTVAGYYQFTTAARLPVGTGSGESWLTFYKNGSSAKRIMNYQALTNTGVFMQQGTALIYMNGSTDYVEVYIQHNVGSSQTLWAASMGCYFQGVLVRAA